LIKNPILSSITGVGGGGSAAYPSMKVLRRHRKNGRNDGSDEEVAPLAPLATKALSLQDRADLSRDRWTRLRDHVTSGSALLRTSVMVAEREPHGGMDYHADNHDGRASEEGDRASRREQAIQVIRDRMHFTLAQCIAAILVYIGVAVLAYSFLFEEQWSVIDSVYFSVVAFSSVGFGDVTPTSPLGRAFASFFTLSSIACLGVAVGVVGNQLLDAQQSALDRAKTLSERHVVSLFSAPGTSHEEPEIQTCASASPAQEGDTEPDKDPYQKKPERGWVPLARELVMVAVVLSCFAVLIVMVDPSITPGNVAYFLIITSTTCGFGDVAPVSPSGRLLTAFLIPLAVGAMGRWLGLVASWIIDARQRQARQQLWSSHDLTLEDLEVMDEDGDGNVTRAEFLEFMLLAMDKVDRPLVDELRAQFASLDTDGTGVLSRGDLIAIGRRKLQCPARKLALSRYKKQLLEQQQSSARRRGAAEPQPSSDKGTWLSRLKRPLAAFVR
jgi:hypothetical protein